MAVYSRPRRGAFATVCPESQLHPALGDAATSNNIALLIGASTGVPLLIGAVVANTRYKDCMQSAKRAYLTEVAPALWAEAQQAVRLQR